MNRWDVLFGLRREAKVIAMDRSINQPLGQGKHYLKPLYSIKLVRLGYINRQWGRRIIWRLYQAQKCIHAMQWFARRKTVMSFSRIRHGLGTSSFKEFRPRRQSYSRQQKDFACTIHSRRHNAFRSKFKTRAKMLFCSRTRRRR